MTPDWSSDLQEHPTVASTLEGQANVPPNASFPTAYGPTNPAAPQYVASQSNYPPLAGYGSLAVQKTSVFRRHKAAIITATILAVVTVSAVASQNIHKAGTSSGIGYNNPSTLEDALTAQVDDRMSDASGQYYNPGVTVTSDICVLQTAHTFTCVIEDSDGDSASDDVVVSADGQNYVTK